MKYYLESLDEEKRIVKEMYENRPDGTKSAALLAKVGDIRPYFFKAPI